MSAMKFYRENFNSIYNGVKAQAPLHHFEFSDPFWILITTMLSHRTKDPVTDKAARGLFSKYGNCRLLASASYDDVISMIEKVGFYKAKAKRIIGAARIISERFQGAVPRTREELMQIPGVGRKTANVVLADGFGIPEIAVDTHVHRISNRLGISGSKDPEEVEMALKKIVPVEFWLGFNPMLVEFGKIVCKPIGPRCDSCSISAYCDYFKKSIATKKVKVAGKGTSERKAGARKRK